MKKQRFFDSYSNHAIVRFFERVKPNKMIEIAELFLQKDVELSEHNIATYIKLVADGRNGLNTLFNKRKFSMKVIPRPQVEHKYKELNSDKETFYYVEYIGGRPFVFVVRERVVITIFDYSEHDFKPHYSIATKKKKA